MSIETHIQKLEALISQLDSDDIHIEKSVELYGKIIGLSSDIAKELQTLNKTIVTLKKQADDVIESVS